MGHSDWRLESTVSMAMNHILLFPLARLIDVTVACYILLPLPPFYFSTQFHFSAFLITAPHVQRNILQPRRLFHSCCWGGWHAQSSSLMPTRSDSSSICCHISGICVRAQSSGGSDNVPSVVCVSHKLDLTDTEELVKLVPDRYVW